MMLRRSNNEFNPEDTLQSHEANSIICQIPINYDDFQNRRTGRSSEATSSRTNLHQRNELKVSVKNEITHEDLDNKSREYLETDTPMFSYNKSSETDIQGLKSICSPDAQDKQFKKIVEMAFDQIERLQDLRDFLYEQSSRLQKFKEEVSKNSRLVMSDFTDKYRAALKQLEVYFHSNLDKIKEIEQEKSDFLADKIDNNNKLISEIGTKINEMESKMKIDSVPYFIYLFENNYHVQNFSLFNNKHLEKFLQIPRFDEESLQNGWKNIAVPSLEINLYPPSRNVLASIDGQSLLETQPKDLEPISLNKKPRNMLSPQIITNTDTSFQYSKRIDLGKESMENPVFLKKLEATELDTGRSDRDKEELDAKSKYTSNPHHLQKSASHSRYASISTQQSAMTRQNSRSPISRGEIEYIKFSKSNREKLERENRDLREKDNRDNRDNRDFRDNRDRSDHRDHRDYRDNRDERDERENREYREKRDYKDDRENRDYRNERDEREHREKDHRDRDYNRDHKDYKSKENREHKDRERENRENRDRDRTNRDLRDHSENRSEYERSASRTRDNHDHSNEDKFYSKDDRRGNTKLKERPTAHESTSTRSKDNTNHSVSREKEKEAKKKTYKDVIKKLEKESKKKEKLLEDMIESYKTLESKYERDVLGKKQPDLYEEVLKTVSSIVKKHESQFIDKPVNFIYTKRVQEAIKNDEKKWESEALYNNENAHEVKKKAYKNMRDPVKGEYAGAQSTLYEPASNYVSSTMRRNYSTDKFSSTNTKRLMNSLQVSKIFIEDETPQHLIESFGNNKSEELRRRFKVFIPLGTSDCSNFFVVSAEKNDTIRDLLETMLQHLGLDEEKSYKYYFTVKLEDDSPEKTVLVTAKIWSFLDASHEIRVKSWPKFFLRTYDQKEHYDIKKFR